MKILYYSPHPDLNLQAPSGPGRHMREVIRAFEERGHEVIPIIMGGLTMDDSADIEFSHSSTKQTLRKMMSTSMWNWLKDRKLKKFDRQCRTTLTEAIKKEQPDLVYERGYYLMTSGVEAASRNNVPHIIEINAPYPEEKVEMEGERIGQNAGFDAERKQVSLTHRVVVVSSALKEYLVERHRIDENKVVVTPNAVTPEDFETSPGELEELKSELGYTEENTIIGFVGSIFPYHGVDRLIHAFQSVTSLAAGMRLLVVGDGEILPQLKALVDRSVVRDKVKFTGNIRHKDVPKYIGIMDITVMPKSNWYGSPVKIFEYGAMGKIVIAPDNIPVNDVMNNAEHGLLIDDNNESLVAAIKEVMENKKRCEGMAEAFRTKVLHDHTWNMVAEIILQSFE